GSGRTDAGVHALRQYFHYVSDKEKDLKQLTYALNKMLPDDSKILSLSKFSYDFHARYNATKKSYEYRILLTNKDPLSYDLAYIYPMALDIELFKKALQKFEGTHNYQDFTSKEEDEGGFIRTIYNIEVIKEGDLLRVVFTGNGFMRYQIRNMIGSAINVANKKEPLEFIDEHLKDNKNRDIIAYKAPASGLYLVDVIYD
ncbi:MAG: tRNA pseudouridine(38-40) synthase TruA, partial [Bacilli bacterium]|nr:tRNA pseudouridine(38-40) synthase TruA [Bacilli bacterium]